MHEYTITNNYTNDKSIRLLLLSIKFKEEEEGMKRKQRIIIHKDKNGKACHRNTNNVDSINI